MAGKENGYSTLTLVFVMGCCSAVLAQNFSRPPQVIHRVESHPQQKVYGPSTPTPSYSRRSDAPARLDSYSQKTLSPTVQTQALPQRSVQLSQGSHRVQSHPQQVLVQLTPPPWSYQRSYSQPDSHSQKTLSPAIQTQPLPQRNVQFSPRTLYRCWAFFSLVDPADYPTFEKDGFVRQVGTFYTQESCMQNLEGQVAPRYKLGLHGWSHSGDGGKTWTLCNSVFGCGGHKKFDLEGVVFPKSAFTPK